MSEINLKYVHDLEWQNAKLREALGHSENEKLTVSDADKSMIEWLRSKIARLEKAGEALMYYADYNDEDNIWRCIKCGSLWKHINDEKHYDDCPVTEWMEAKK